MQMDFDNCSNKIITCLRSGAQSGVDRAALDFARKHNIEICGWCPKGGWAEDYPEAPGVLALYPELKETSEAGPAQRTLWNMRDADAVLTIMPEGAVRSQGTELGVQEGMRLEKPMFTAHGVEDVPEIVAWLKALVEEKSGGIELCVGGPRASECVEAYRVTMEVLEGVWEFMK